MRTLKMLRFGLIVSGSIFSCLSMSSVEAARAPAVGIACPYPLPAAYSLQSSKSMCGGRGGGRCVFGPSTNCNQPICGDLNNYSTSQLPCDHNPWDSQFIPVDQFCQSNFEARDGNCQWQRFWNRGSENTRMPWAHNVPMTTPPNVYPASLATGGIKVCCPANANCALNPALVYNAPCAAGDLEGWRCEGDLSDNGGGSCHHSRLFTTAHCVPKIAGCNVPSPVLMEMLPAAANQPFKTCRGNPSAISGGGIYTFQPNNQYDSKYPNTFLQFCEGSCTPLLDTRMTLCSNVPNTYNCTAVSVPSHSPRDASGTLQPYPSCPGGTNEWFRYATGNPINPNHDALVKVCCGTLPPHTVQVLHALPGYGPPMNGPSPNLYRFQECSTLGQDWVEMGRVGADMSSDSKLTFCIK